MWGFFAFVFTFSTICVTEGRTYIIHTCMCLHVYVYVYACAKRETFTGLGGGVNKRFLCVQMYVSFHRETWKEE